VTLNFAGETPDPVLAAQRRGDFIERRHRGAYAILSADGAVEDAAGDIDRPFLPRSAVKLFQALPLVESGAADAARLSPRRLALACASHQGSERHAGEVAAWLGGLGLDAEALLCGSQTPSDPPTRAALRAEDRPPSALHNNCSGKHAGFLTLSRELGAPEAEYLEPERPVQRRVREAFAEATGREPEGWAVDGCSAPNFATTLRALALGCARVAAGALPAKRAEAARRLVAAMAAHPFEVAGEGRACTELIEAAEGRAVIKTGAEGCFTAILPERGLGAALKIADGDTAAAECAMAALLVRLGAVSAEDPRVARRLRRPLFSRRGVKVGDTTATAELTRA
jgi:L-asparaginase II